MLKYLIIQLDDSSVSFCHYDNCRTKRKLIPLDILKEGIFWSMKENLALQFLYPDYTLPDEYKEVIADTFHTDIVSSTCADTDLRMGAEVVVFDSCAAIEVYPFDMRQAYVFRTDFNDLCLNSAILHHILSKVNRLNIVITDIATLSETDMDRYATFLENLGYRISQEYRAGHPIQINSLTDRLLLDNMNNCNAGEETITLSPDGNFHICPAFYLDGSSAVGNLGDGLDIKTPQLYKLSHAPICRRCDAYQCRRCIWLNKKTTLEVNTPSHEQCVISHIERNASRALLKLLRQSSEFLPGHEIKEVDYLDPFDLISK